MSKKATDKTTGRQVWDKEYHRERAVTASTREKEALERLGGDVLAVLGKEKKHKEPPPPEERKNLVHRDYDLKLDHKLGTLSLYCLPLLSLYCLSIAFFYKLISIVYYICIVWVYCICLFLSEIRCSMCVLCMYCINLYSAFYIWYFFEIRYFFV
eukprot:GHVR01023719.1.p1 GENE.GHVR01023719.1~~GHVR01023719.1.p1  ORF type:complete len:155 (+),score=30.20 GHVR01023719.1:176-640(+)